MADWFDIERVLDKLEELDKPILESFARVMPPPSRNPNFHRRFEAAKQRILRRLSQIEAEELRVADLSAKDGLVKHDGDCWYKKPVGIIALTVVAGLLVALIKYAFGI